MTQLTLDEKAQMTLRAGRASVAVAVTLVLIKAFAWVMTDSVAMLGTLLDSFLDLLASGVMLMALSYATTPADREHRFGHGKVEAIASLGQAALIAVSALFLLVQSIERLINPSDPENTRIGIIVMVISMALTAGLVRYQRRVAERTGSLGVAADSMHYMSDILMNAGVLIALMAVSYGAGALTDAVMGCIIAAILAKTVWSIARGAYDMLMDRELPDEDRTRIKEIVLAHPEVRGFHELRTRTSGLVTFIQFHVELDASLTFPAAHAVAAALETELAKTYRDADIIIHTDPLQEHVG